MTKKLVKKECKFAGYELQLKVKVDVSEDAIRKLGAKRLGNVLHEDKYFIPKGEQVNGAQALVRIRKEGGENLLFTYKGPVAKGKTRNRLVINRPINEKDALRMTQNYTEIISVNKKRTIFVLDSIVINLDDVEHLGRFIEFEIGKKENYYKIDALLHSLGLEPKDTTVLSYFELALMNLSPIQRMFTKIHDKFGRFAFGISSAVLTTLGIVVGLNSATESLLAVIGGIVSVAIADSLSDSIGMYASKKAERGCSGQTAFKSAFNTFLGKFIFTLTFIIPFIFFQLPFAIYVCILWGLVLLTFVNVQIAFLQAENVPKAVAKNLLIALAVIIASYLVGKLVFLVS